MVNVLGFRVVATRPRCLEPLGLAPYSCNGCPAVRKVLVPGCCVSKHHLGVENLTKVSGVGLDEPLPAESGDGFVQLLRSRIVLRLFVTEIVREQQ